MCLYPTIIKNKKYSITKKNKGIVPIPNDPRTLWVTIPCGRCRDCMKKKAREWQIRIKEDIKINKNGKFVALTFSNESIKELYNDLMETYEKTPEGYELDNLIATLAVKRFSDRWKAKYKKRPRHWLITELGHNGTENIHLHGIIWTDKPFNEIRKIWKYGFIYPRYKHQEKENYVSNRTINYCIKYFTKKDKDHTEYQAIMLTSPRIGANYLKRPDAQRNKYNPNGETIETITNEKGYKIALPDYYKKKLYTDEEREELMIEKIDKGIKYIGGNKIDITTKKGIKEYLKALEYEQKKAKRLGYSGPNIDTEKKAKQEETRTINLAIRLNNNKRKSS